MNTQNHQRRHYLIDRAFQGRFIAWMVGLVALSGILSGLLLYLLLGSDLASQGRSLHLSLEKVMAGLGLTIVLGNMLATALIGATAAWMVLHLSHRIAGPLYRLRRLFREVAAGNYEVDTTLRDDDQLQELAAEFAEMTAALRQREERRREAVERCLALLGQAREGGDPATLEALRETLEELR